MYLGNKNYGIKMQQVCLLYPHNSLEADACCCTLGCAPCNKVPVVFLHMMADRSESAVALASFKEIDDTLYPTIVQ